MVLFFFREELRTRGILAFYTGDFETASASFQQILKFNPLSIESWTNLGVSYEKLIFFKIGL